MPDRRSARRPGVLVAGFFIRLFLIYGVLAFPWPAVSRLYATAYRAVAQAWFDPFGPGGAVRFRPLEGRGGMDTEIAIRGTDSALVGHTPHNSRLTGYLPTAELVALILATPLGWKRRLAALGWGLLGAQLFLWLRLKILLLHFFGAEAPWAIYEPGPFWRAAIGKSFEVLVVSPTLAFVVPVFIWILATFRRGDLELVSKLFERESAA